MEREPERRKFVGYHGTSMLSVPALLRGVASQVERNFVGTGQLGIGLYVTDDYPLAVEFVRVAARMVGGYPSVVFVYASNFEKLVGREVPRTLWWRVPDASAYITDVDYLTALVDGYAPIRQVKFNPRAYHTLSLEVPG